MAGTCPDALDRDGHGTSLVADPSRGAGSFQIGQKARRKRVIHGNLAFKTRNFWKIGFEQTQMPETLSVNLSLCPLFSYTFPDRPSFFILLGVVVPRR
jgi:hypothetical protein